MCSGSPTCPQWSPWCEHHCHTSSCSQQKGGCSLEGYDLWETEKTLIPCPSVIKPTWLMGRCMYVHLMGPKKEDRHSLLTSVLWFTDLNTHAQKCYMKINGVRIHAFTFSLCVGVYPHPGRPVREALHLSKHQVPWFEVIPVLPRHPAASEGIKPTTFAQCSLLATERQTS